MFVGKVLMCVFCVAERLESVVFRANGREFDPRYGMLAVRADSNLFRCGLNPNK